MGRFRTLVAACASTLLLAACVAANLVGDTITVYGKGTKTLLRTIADGVNWPNAIVFGPKSWCSEARTQGPPIRQVRRQIHCTIAWLATPAFRYSSWCLP